LLRRPSCLPCIDVRREQEPWEAADGAVLLLRELARVDAEAAAPFLPSLAQHAAGGRGEGEAVRVARQTGKKTV
jgi:hypothetical protein